MQRNEVIIDQFVKTIKESAPMVNGDPVLLNQIFNEMEKRKTRKKFIGIFLSSAVVLITLGFVAWNYGVLNNTNPQVQKMKGPSTHLALMVPHIILSPYYIPTITEDAPVVKRKTTKSTSTENTDYNNVVSYKFNNHQVDVFNGKQEFIQINVFGADGVEQDVLKIMEDLKKSYRKNEVYVDSVKHK